MSVLNFDKSNLGNLEYSLQREILATNRAGGYLSTSIVCCNTRKYHGLMVVPRTEQDEGNCVLLSSLDETITQHDQSFNLAIHRFPDIYEPRGHKYITDFRYTPCVAITYRVGGVVLRKELLWVHSRTQLLVRYTLVEAHSRTVLKLRPFLAFRDSHSLSQANMFADGRTEQVDSGVKCRLYTDFPWLYMQSHNQCEFVPAPDWYYNFEYLQERQRGYPCREDLLTPGYFECEIAAGQSVVFSFSTGEVAGAELAGVFDAELAKRSDKIDFLSCLRHSARQFIARRGAKTEVVAGYPWFGRWGRDTFIALPGITLTQGGVESCVEVIDTMTREMKDGLFPNMGTAYNSVDAPLWFFWTLQRLEERVGAEKIWNSWGERMKEVLESFRRGIGGGAIALHENGLVWAASPGHALTWMDAVVDGMPVTGREGYAVEINALWYNAVRYALDLAGRFGDERFVKEWEGQPGITKASFLDKFWIREESRLADYTDGCTRNMFIRPNQIIACSMPHTMLDHDQIMGVVACVRQHLLTPKGLRTLSPRNPLYEGRYGGDQPTRDRQYHQGTVWPWLLEHYAKANFDLYGADFTRQAREMLEAFDEDISSGGIGSISEIYDGDPPYDQRGAISQAWSVAAVLSINEMIEKHTL